VRLSNCLVAILLFLLPVILVPRTVQAQKDPGPRDGVAAAGGPYSNLSPAELGFFSQAIKRFMEVDSVSGTIEDGSGLGADLQRKQLRTVPCPARNRG
jgi:hypothetical protein